MMTCTQIRELLPVHLYGDVPADEADAITRHLRDCLACRAEAAALSRVRSALDEMSTPPMRVDVSNLFATAAERNVRRWRRLAVAAAALAAGLLIVFGLKLHVTIGNGQIVIAWSDRVSRDAEALRSGARDAVALRSADSASRLTAIEDRVHLQQDLIRALAADIESRDRQRSADIDAVRLRVDAVQQYAARQWADAERTMNALYVAQFKRPEEKNP